MWVICIFNKNIFYVRIKNINEKIYRKNKRKHIKFIQWDLLMTKINVS